ncbi:MAG: bacteriohemerythrin [Deltaproteobacteria bacterium]|nr:bacteriohemerythrin [Deltaproteobacteria bacterium]
MPIITWSNDLSVNIKEIDSQHKRLVDLINELHDAMSVGKGNAILGKILSDLIGYTKTHFADEERIMQVNGYPDFSKNKLEHDKLTKEVEEFKNQFDAGKAVVSIEIMKFLKNWLSNHIMKSDKQYTQFLNSKGVF